MLFQFPVSSRLLKVIHHLLTFSSWSSRHLHPSVYRSFNNVLYETVPMQDVTNPVNLPYFYYMYNIPFVLDARKYLFIFQVLYEPKNLVPCLYKPVLVPVLSQKNPVHTLKPCFLTTFLPSMPRSQMLCLHAGLFRSFQRIHIYVVRKFCGLMQNQNLEEGQPKA
jgi:hypothetical protein